MITRRIIFTLMLGALGLGLPLNRAAGISLFSGSWGDVIVATDTTTEGRTLTPPSTEQPVYYRGKSLGCKFGSMPGDREPAVPEMNRFIARVLAKQGYLAAAAGGEESALFLVVRGAISSPTAAISSGF